MSAREIDRGHHVQIYDHNTIDAFSWPDTTEGKKARDYLLPLIKENVETFIRNVSTKMYLVVSNSLFLPITVNDAEYENSYIASNYYGLNFYDELMSVKHPIFSKIQKPFLKLGKKFLQKIEINKCIFINNWLMTNNLSSEACLEDFENIVQFLQNKFPKHVLIYRNVDKCLQQSLLTVLEKSNFHLLKTRNVFLYDPAKKQQLSAKALSHHRKDRKILEKYGFEIERNFSEEDIEKMLSLYEKVYITNHTHYSPQYQKKFIKNLLENKIFHFVGLKKEGKLEGIMGFFVKNETMVTPFFGYDTDVEYSGELYRLLSLLILEESERANIILNDSSGGEKTKKYRGLISYPEFMGVYHHHLPFGKRLFWSILSKVYRRIIKSY